MKKYWQLNQRKCKVFYKYIKRLRVTRERVGFVRVNKESYVEAENMGKVLNK